MTTTTAELALRVKAALIAEAESALTPADLTEETPLNSPEFRLDSMAFLRAVMRIEDDLGIRIDESALGCRRLATVGEVLTVVANSMTGG